MLLVDVFHRLREANHAARALLGGDAARWAGQPLRSVLPPGVDAEQVHRAYCSALTQTPTHFTWFKPTAR